MVNLTNLQKILMVPAQGEQVCFKDSKCILFEILANRTWKGRTSSCWFGNLAGSAGRSLYGPSLSDFLGFQTKYICYPWGIPVHLVQLVLLYLSTLLDSWLAHCASQIQYFTGSSIITRSSSYTKSNFSSRSTLSSRFSVFTGSSITTRSSIFTKSIATIRTAPYIPTTITTVPAQPAAGMYIQWLKER